jgi:hypothetical protein
MMADISLTGVLIVAAIAFAVPLILALAPALHLPSVARPPPGGMLGDPRPVAASLRAPDLPWVIAQKEHAAARRPADGEPVLVAIGEFNCRARDRRLEQGVGIARRAPRRPGPRASERP